MSFNKALYARYGVDGAESQRSVTRQSIPKGSSAQNPSRANLNTARLRLCDLYEDLIYRYIFLSVKRFFAAKV